MKVAQGLATAIICLLLFICLSVFGVGLIIDATVLNESFMTGQVQKIDLAEVTRDVIEREDLLDLPPEVEFARPYVYEVIDDYEPWLQEQAENIIQVAYGYLKGDRESFYIVIPVSQVKATIKPKLWEEVEANLAAVVPEILRSNLSSTVEDYIEQYIHLVPPELLPPGTLDMAPRQIVAFLRGYLNETNLTIMMLAVPQLRDLLEDAVRPYFDEYIDEFLDDVPDNYVIDDGEIGPEAVQDLETARRYIGYFRTGYYALIGVAVLLVIGVVLIYRRMVEIFLSLGITFSLFGIMTVAAALFGRTLSLITYVPANVPDAVRTGLAGTFADALMPLLWFGIGILVIGIIMIVVAVVARQREAED